jgi:hypothetical protein
LEYHHNDYTFHWIGSLSGANSVVNNNICHCPYMVLIHFLKQCFQLIKGTITGVKAVQVLG